MPIVEFNRDRLMQGIRTRAKLRTIGDEFREYWDTPKRWNLIRKLYKEVEPMILSGERISPYFAPFADYMTPIERAVWGEIRCYGLPFYMQYPVGRRFVDFGDPVEMVAIEVDGAAYHTPEADAKKTEEIMNEGWILFRITGKDAFYKQNAIADVAEHYGVRLHSEEEWQE